MDILLLGLIAGLIGFRIIDNHGKGFWHYIALTLLGVIFGAILFGNV